MWGRIQYAIVAAFILLAVWLGSYIPDTKTNMWAFLGTGVGLIVAYLVTLASVRIADRRRARAAMRREAEGHSPESELADLRERLRSIDPASSSSSQEQR